MHLPCDIVPQFIQRIEDRRKRPAAVMVKQAGNVLKQQKFRFFNGGNPCDLKEKRSSGIIEPSPLSCDRKTLIVIGNSMMSSPNFPPRRTVHEIFTSHGVPSIKVLRSFIDWSLSLRYVSIVSSVL